MSLDIDSYELKEIRDICDINCSSYSQKESWNFFNYLDTKNITKGKIDEIKYLDPLEDTVPSRAKRKVNNKDIIYSTVRPNQEHYGLIENQPDNFLVSTGFTTLKVDTEKAIPEYVYYFITQNHITESLQTIAEQSTTSYPSIRPSDIGDLLIPLPPLGIQNKISSILRNIDYKIKLNEQINKNLDNLIKILFKNFFEDFKPFENQEFKDSEIGKIPVDWDLVDLGSIIKIYNGYSYKGNELQESNCAMATIKNFNRDGSFRADGFKEILYSDKIKDHHFLNDNDVLISCTDVTQDADIIGNCILLQNKQGYGEVIMSMDLVKIESQIPEINNFLLASILRSYRFKYHILGYVNGTTVLHLDKKGISKFKLALPNDLTILEEFGNTIGLIYNQIGNNLKEIDTLSKVRDTLLPKLMSGEINVSKINCDLE